MSEPTPPLTPQRDQIECYLDNAMSTSDRAAFETQMLSDAQLRSQVEQTRRENAALAHAIHSRFALPEDCDLEAAVHDAARLKLTSRPPSRSTNWLVAARWSAMAAALVLCVGGGLLFQRLQSQARERGQQLIAYYSEQVQLGLTPQWVCKDEKTFREYTTMRFGAPLSFNALPSGVALVGWTYVRGPMRTDSNAVLMATRDETPILVIVEKRGNAPRIDAAQQSSLHVFRKDLGAVTLYELTPLASPTLLDVLREVN